MPRTSTLFDPRKAIPWQIGVWADDPSWVQKPSDGGYVQTWRNFGSTTTAVLDYVAGSGARSVTWSKNVSSLNNRAGVYFGANGGYLSTGANSVNVPSPSSLVVVCQQVADVVWTSHPLVTGLYPSAFANQGFWVSSGGSPNFSSSLPNTKQPTLYAAVPKSQSYSTTAPLMQFMNGSAEYGTGPNNYGLGGLTIGFGSNYYWEGWVSFLGIYNNDITTHAQWPSFKEWVRSYYGINVLRGSV